MPYAVIVNLRQLKVYLSAGVVVIEDRRGEKGPRLYHRSRLMDLDRDVYVGLMFEEVEKSFESQKLTTTRVNDGRNAPCGGKRKV